MATKNNSNISFFKRLKIAFSGQGGHSGSTPNYLNIFYPSSSYDYYSQSGELWHNSAVMNCIGWMQRTFPEAELQVINNKQKINKHPLVKLINKPNPYYGADVLWQHVIMDWALYGNAYWHKVRDETGRVVEIWPIQAKKIEPRWPQDGREFISHYEYWVNNRWIKINKGDIIHFRFGYDPRNIRKGISPISANLKEVSADNEANTYTASILRNMAIPGLAIIPKDSESDIGPEAANSLREWWQAQFSGDGRGKPLIPSSPITIEKIALTPEELTLKDIRQVPEDRICAAFGIPPMVVGLTSGALHKTYANYREAKAAAYESNVIPTQKLFASQLQIQLLPDLGDIENEEIDWSYRNVRVFIEEETKRNTSAALLYKSGLLTKNEARAILEYDSVDDGDEFSPNLSGRESLMLEREVNRDPSRGLGRPQDEGKSYLVEQLKKLREDTEKEILNGRH